MRRAVDTNVLVRLLVVDDVEQSDRAADLVSRGGVEVETTVILETEWVLRGVFRLDRQTVGDLLVNLLGLTNIRIVERRRVIAAVALHRDGLDFADALHLIAAYDGDEFMTFDRALANCAERLGVPIPVQLL